MALNGAKKQAAELLARAAAAKLTMKAGWLTTRKAAGKICARACFTADTLVQTRFGPRPIAEVVVGDEVWAWDEHSEAAGWKPVMEVFRSQAEEVAEILFANDPYPLVPDPCALALRRAGGLDRRRRPATR